MCNELVGMGGKTDHLVLEGEIVATDFQSAITQKVVNKTLLKITLRKPSFFQTLFNIFFCFIGFSN